jgi:hypothetical protein
MIVSAAVRINHCVCSMAAPARHHDILRQITGLFDPGERPDHTFENETQGFLTDTGQFLNRREAYDHCIRTGQGLPRRERMLGENKRLYDGEELYSEDLW